MATNKVFTSKDSDIAWIERSFDKKDYSQSEKMFPIEIARTARAFHRQIPGYKTSPLVSLTNLSQMLGVDSIWVKDEAQRLELNSFKVMGGSFAMFRLIQQKLGMKDDEITYDYLLSKECKKKLGDMTFASATDGNHGRGLAWATNKLGFKCMIYVHSATSQPRIDAIAKFGATVKVIKGNYDDAVRQCNEDAKKNGWQVVSDTSWPGYTEIPTWIMQGYNTILLEAQEQFASQGITKPTHVFVQAGVGALAASVIGFYSALFKENSPKFVVVEPSNAACLYETALANDDKCHTVTGDLDTIMAGLACGEPSPIAWEILKRQADVFVKVPDYVAARGMRVLATPLHDDPLVISGESGAVTLGCLYAILSNASDKNAQKHIDELKDHLGIDNKSQILFINTERNTDPIRFRQIIWDGMDPVPERFWTER